MAITYDDFTNIEITLGTILSVEVVEDADKLLKLFVDLGEETPRQILSGIRTYFEDPQELVGKQCPFVTNLAPRTIRGFESNGMILAGNSETTFALFHPSVPLPAGTRLK
jgi:methionyl-tRNA synthetase